LNVRIALGSDRRGVALALPHDFELVHPVDGCGQFKILRHPLPGPHLDRPAHGIEADVGDQQLVPPSGHPGQLVAAGIIGQHPAPKSRQLDPRTREQVAGGGIADRPSNRARRGGQSPAGQQQGKQQGENRQAAGHG